jgi:hypothetical protein
MFADVSAYGSQFGNREACAALLPLTVKQLNMCQLKVFQTRGSGIVIVAFSLFHSLFG